MLAAFEGLYQHLAAAGEIGAGGDDIAVYVVEHFINAVVGDCGAACGPDIGAGWFVALAGADDFQFGGFASEIVEVEYVAVAEAGESDFQGHDPSQFKGLARRASKTARCSRARVDTPLGQWPGRRCCWYQEGGLSV